MNKTKVKMISELKKEFLNKQGLDKARWVSNQLNKMSKENVEEQYKRLKGKVQSTKKTLSPSNLYKRKTVVIGAKDGKMFIKPVKK